MTGTLLLLAAITLNGVTGVDLRARAFFDANNVKVGDPLVLTIDFLGEADFQSLHPPALARAVDRKDWKVDDASAKTDTFRDARRLTYRVRPMRAGVLWFPALEFTYRSATGPRLVRANAIPVHAKQGQQVVVAEMDQVEVGMPQPPDLVSRAAGGFRNEDEAFQWRKAMRQPTVAAFADFDGPEARLNEATCAIREGNWAQALKIYRRLEWTTGQTPEIERGMRAALALRYDNANVELPVWRQVLRPLLRHSWQGRVLLVVGGFGAVALLLWLIGRTISALAAFALVLLLVLAPEAASAQGIFQQMEEQMRQMRQHMNQMTSGFNFSFGGEEVREPVRITAQLSVGKETLQVGDPFDFIIALEAPKSVSVGQIKLTPSERFGLTVTGPVRNLPDGKSANPSNVVKRLAVPVRYDVPFRGRMAFAIEGMVSSRQASHSRRGFMSSFMFSNSFTCDTDPLLVDIRPLATENQPADFSGIVSEGLDVVEYPDHVRVETNDVVTLIYKLRSRGYVPPDYLPAGMAYEWTRDERSGAVEYRAYCVADGRAATPEVKIVYYDPRTKTYKTARCGRTPLKYGIIKGL